MIDYTRDIPLLVKPHTEAKNAMMDDDDYIAMMYSVCHYTPAHEAIDRARRLAHRERQAYNPARARWDGVSVLNRSGNRRGLGVKNKFPKC